VFTAILGILLSVQTAAQGAAPPQRRDTRTWYQAYADAQRDVAQGRWQPAIDNVQAALRLGAPKPGRNVHFYGDVYRDFNPDYFLGVAYLNLKRFAEADGAFERVRQAQLIGSKDREYSTFDQQASNAKFEALLLQAQQALAQSRFDQALAFAKSASGLGMNKARADALAVEITSARDRVAAANAGAKQPPSDLSAAKEPTPTPPGNLPPPPGATAPTAPVPSPDVQSPIQKPPQGLPSGAPPKNPPKANARNSQGVIKAVPVLPSATPADERTALVDFFSGQYQAAASKLTLLAAGPNASPRTYFYLACSQAALVLTGKADPTALDVARRQLALAGDRAKFAADQALISPRIKRALGIQ
jgi:tetratricopeptide (TPR) repeat protein